jgi:mannose/cellobiose epimerase-like protein (N-acyl-D-glucosamine 2-epimerase family)
MKTREEMIYDFVLALMANSAICVGSDDDKKWIVEYATDFANEYLKRLG